MGLPYDELVERYGEHFFKHCLECGYERLLRVLGRNLYDFLCNLDALHDHLTSIYPGMRAPSFRCYLGDDGSMTLRYYSDRKGLERMVSGIIKAVAREFFDTKVNVTLTSRKGKRQDHTVFHVREDNFTTILVRKRSNSLVSILHRAKSSTNPRDLPLSVMSFCKAFPFHLIIDRHFQIIQAGSALCRVLKSYRKKTTKLMFDKVFQVVRPVLNSLNFEMLLDHINTVFITVTKPGVICDRSQTSDPTSSSSSNGGVSASDSVGDSSCGVGSDSTRNGDTAKVCSDSGRDSQTNPSGSDPGAERSQALRLKGQMVFIPETDTIMYLCSPRVTDVDELRERGLYLSDIPIHDATRDLILITQARRAERELVETLEETSNNLKKLQSKLREDKGRTDELLNSLLPSAIAERLRLNQAVEAEKYNLVTILFSDIVGFTAMCGNENVVPLDIVRLLNRLYTHFDVLSNIHDVYKVETIGDAYMVVGGMPEFTASHADQVTSMAFAMMEVAQTVYSPVQSSPIEIRIGIHSGPCVAGVVGQKMPRYCLFGQTVAVASSMENSSLPGKVNISHTARGYLSNKALYIFEENTTREDQRTECCFIRLKNNAPVAMDLGVPMPRGMFRTPNPSPTTSRGTSPVDGTPPSGPSPLRLNSPDGILPKFEMPSIHICDADEEDFQQSLQAKMNDVVITMDTEMKSRSSFEKKPCLEASHGAVSEIPMQTDIVSTMSFGEYLFSDAASDVVPSNPSSSLPVTTTTSVTSTPTVVMSPPLNTTGNFPFEQNLSDDVDVGVRRHSHQPMSCSDLPVPGALDGGVLAKSVTLSDMTDPQATQIMVVSLDSPSSVSSVSEAEELPPLANSAVTSIPVMSPMTTSGSSRSPVRSQGSCQSGSPVGKGVSRWCVPCTSGSTSRSRSPEASDHSPAYGNEALNSKSSNSKDHGCVASTAGRFTVGRDCVISRRRSEPAKHVDLSKIVVINQPRTDCLGSHPAVEAHSPGAIPKVKHRPGVVTKSRNGTAQSETCKSAIRQKHAGDYTAENSSMQKMPSCHSSPGELLPERQSDPNRATASGERQARDRLHSHGGPLQNFQRDRLSKDDLKRIKENGRLVIYFKGRPRSMSPSLRLHPLTVPEGSRSLHDSPFSSPRLTQKLNYIQGELSAEGGGGQGSFFRHVRLKRRDLNV